MINYDQLINNMTIEQMCDKNVHLVLIDNKRLGWATSTGHVFPYTERPMALTFEMAWLTKPVAPENAAALEPEKEVVQC